MAHDEPQAAGPSRLVIRNIGLLLSGAMEKPILDADTILAENGKITAIGRAKDVNTEGATTIVDANGTTVAPGLIDTVRAAGKEPARHAAHNPLGARRGVPDDIAALVGFLCGPRGRYITGQTIHANGGVAYY